MITLQDIINAELAKRAAGAAWVDARDRAADLALDRRVRVEAGLVELDAREALTAAGERFRALLEQAVREAGEAKP